MQMPSIENLVQSCKIANEKPLLGIQIIDLPCSPSSYGCPCWAVYPLHLCVLSWQKIYLNPSYRRKFSDSTRVWQIVETRDQGVSQRGLCTWLCACSVRALNDYYYYYKHKTKNTKQKIEKEEKKRKRKNKNRVERKSRCMTVGRDCLYHIAVGKLSTLTVLHFTTPIRKFPFAIHCLIVCIRYLLLVGRYDILYSLLFICCLLATSTFLNRSGFISDSRVDFILYYILLFVT